MRAAVEVAGVPVIVENTRPDVDTGFVLQRFQAAISLIAQAQPWRLTHLQQDIRQFWIVAYPCRGAYFPAERTIMTELSFLARATEFTPAVIASSIVHEGIHARVHAMRLHRGWRPASHDMAREERLCRRAELAFGLALPPGIGTPVVERAQATLTLSDGEVAPTIDWKAAHAVKAEADRVAVRAWKGNKT